MLFVHHDEANLFAQGTERNARAYDQMRPRLKQTVVCIESFSST